MSYWLNRTDLHKHLDWWCMGSWVLTVMASYIERHGYMTSPLKYLWPWDSVKHLWAKTPRAHVPAVNKRERKHILCDTGQGRTKKPVFDTCIFPIIFVLYLFCCVNYNHEYELLWALWVLLANQQTWEWTWVPQNGNITTDSSIKRIPHCFTMYTNSLNKWVSLFFTI